MKLRRLLLAGLAAFCVALPAWSDGARKSTAIEIGSLDNPDESVIWLAYAVGLAHWASESGALERAPEGLLEPSFEGELMARKTLLAIWREMLQSKPKSSAYMDALMRIDAAGYLPEYVWTVHWRGSWKQPPAQLRIAEFYAWQRKELVGHVPRTGARVRVVLSPPEAAASAASR